MNATEHKQKYKPFSGVSLPDREWPNRRITKAPRWLSTDLRDGNQAIYNPMDIATKLEFFRMLTKIGFKEIEVGFPSASQIEFDFVRELIEGGHIPSGVTVQVLTQARPELIDRTMESLAGVKQAIVHVYTATSPTFREVVFGMSKEEVMDMTVAGITQIQELAAMQPKTKFSLEYSPETFSQTEMPYVRDVCNAAIETWTPKKGSELILNLPATVEACMPNQYADMIEWTKRNLITRDNVSISLHTHNDRGTAVAAVEMGLLAGANRVEGCLFGNGERTGNADIVTLALNLYTQGLLPGLDFSNIDEIVETVERCTGIPVHPRHPYAGKLVQTAFSGGHQDAINKGFKKRDPASFWNVPYLSIDPQDIGRKYESLIRINSQSGKGGIAHVLESAKGFSMPRNLQIEFSGVVQKRAEEKGTVVSSKEIWTLFKEEYTETREPLQFIGQTLFAAEDNKSQGIQLDFLAYGRQLTVRGMGNGPIDAAVKALDLHVDVQSYEEQSLCKGSDAKAIAFLEMTVNGDPEVFFGVGIDANTVTASIRAVFSGINRASCQGKLKVPSDYGAARLKIA
ncbi:MAG: 2-isopropylmalate synthase [Bdellovibrionales bacterium]